MNLVESIVQFVLAGGSVVAATYVGRRFPYLGALILLFPAKVLATVIFLPDGDKVLLGRFLIAIIPGLIAVAAFAVVARLALYRLPPYPAFGIGLAAWGIVAVILAFIGNID